MIAVLSALLVVAVISAVALAGYGARRSAAAGREKARADRLEAQLAETLESERRAGSRTDAAESRLRALEQRAVVAERRAGEADQRADAAERRRAGVEQRVAELEADLAARRAAPPIWPLEEVRVRREWTEVVGPGIDLPHPWGAGLAAVVAAELAVIREVMGTPGDLIQRGAGRVADPLRAAAAVRACVEALRAVARAGTPMDVTVSDEAVTVVLADATDLPAELASVAGAAAACGVVVSTDPSPPGSAPVVRVILAPAG